MQIDNKFYIGDTVYDYLGNKYQVRDIAICQNEERIDFSYHCVDIYNTYRDMFESDLFSENPRAAIFDGVKIGTVYYFIDSTGLVCDTCFNDTAADRNRYKFRNFYKTEAEAEQVAKRIEVHLILKRLAGNYTFTEGGSNWFLVANSERGLEVWDMSDFCSPGIVYFDSRQAAMDAIEIIGENVLLRDYFGIETKEESA